jgi:hypothetical protein
MSTKRKSIESLRKKLNELNADSTYSNQFLYQTLLEQGKWLIRREASAGRVWASSSLFQPLTIRVIEVPLIDSCLPIKTGCRIFRSAERLPDLWEDANGPLLKSVSSVDGSTDFFYTTSTVWMQIRKDPYRSKGTTKYVFFEDGYLWFPEHNPNFATVFGFYTDDISMHEQDCLDCEKKDCIRFLDTPFWIPGWVEAEMMAKAVELLAGVTKRLPDDEQINKNPNTKA